MDVAVIGGTGVLGRLVVEELAARGDTVWSVSRRAPAPDSAAADALARGIGHRAADLRDGTGLAAALEGAAAVVDASNDASRAAPEVLVEGGRRLLEAEARAGVAHHVAISIVGCDRTPMAYYRAKVAQEAVVGEGPVAWSLLRATQFHQLVAALFAATAAKARIVPSGPARVQPIDPAVVAVLLADAVHAGPGGRLADVGGPEVRTLSELAATWRAHERARGGRRVAALRVPLPPRLGRALRAGTLCTPEHALAGPTFAHWLAHEGSGVRESAVR